MDKVGVGLSVIVAVGIRLGVTDTVAVGVMVCVAVTIGVSVGLVAGTFVEALTVVTCAGGVFDKLVAVA